MAARAEVSAAIRERYSASGRAAKGVILDEFVALTGLHRKHAIRLLGAGPEERRSRGRPTCRYGSAVKEALAVLWEASDRVCSKLPILLPALERHGQLAPDAELREAPRDQPGDDRPSAVGDADRRSARTKAAGGLQLGSAAIGAGADLRRLG